MLPWFPATRTHTVRGCSGASTKPVLHASQGLLDPAVNLGEGQIVLASDFSDDGTALDDVHYQGGVLFAVQRLTVGSSLISSS